MKLRERAALLRNCATIARDTLAIVRDPGDIGPVFSIIDALIDPRTGLATDARVAELVRVMSARPGCATLLKERPLAPGPMDLHALLRLPPGTLGRTFAGHMFSHGLQGNDFYSPRPPARDIEWLNLRIRQMHDLWHVLTGFGVDYAGEVGLQALTAGIAPALFPQTAVGLGLLRALPWGPAAMISVSEAAADGYHAARCCPQLLCYRFEERWDQPLADLVREIGLPQVAADRPYARRPGPHPLPTS